MKSHRFSLGTISATGAWATLFVLMLFGNLFPLLIPAVIYGVTCRSAFAKRPARFWRPFTVISLVVATCAAMVCPVGFQREISGVVVIGFPFPQPLANASPHSLEFILNSLFVSGCCLLPLAATSTLHSVREFKKLKT